MNTKDLERLHRIAFSTPSILKSLPLLIVSFFLIYTLNLNIVNFVFFAVLLAILTPLLKAKFETARYTFFVTFVTLSSILSDSISKVIGSSPNGVFVAFLTSTVLYFVSDSGTIKTLIASTLLSLTLYPKVETLLGIILGVAFILTMDRDFYGYNLKECFKSFLLSWLTNDPNYFERILLRKAEEVRGWVRCLKVGKAKIVTTSFHPGPIRNVGGARLVKMVNSIENAFYLHSPTDHSMNPASSEEVEKIVKSIPCNGIKLSPMEPFEVHGERYTLTVFPFDKLRLIFVSGRECIDDLPKELNIRSAVVIDAHNAHCENFEPDLRELRDLIEKSLRIKTKSCKLKCLFKKFRVETNSICGSVAILVLDYTNCRYVVVAFDGNNVKLEFRREIERFCEERGFKAIVASTDNHSKTGITTKFTYLPVGSDERDRVVFKFLEECLKGKTEDCEISFGEREVRVKVAGEKFCKFIERAGVYGLKVAIAYLSLLTLSFILSTMI